jgi:hypothetical protein
MEYEVKFEVFDKKLKVKIKAESEIDALEYVKSIIKIRSIVSVQAQPKTSKNDPIPPENGTVDDWYKYFEDLLGGLSRKS